MPVLAGTTLTDICLALFRRNRLGSEDEPAVQSETAAFGDRLENAFVCDPSQFPGL